ncbi:N-6 DNA methylase [bacterium]|nr:N-6 DNA methylase [bacterium]MBU1959107.1 N-6 DNA methylase [bacterium]
MTIIEIEEKIQQLVETFEQEQFIFDFLLAFGEPKATISRLKKGNLNQLESKGELTHRKKLFFKIAQNNLHSTIDRLKNETQPLKQKPRFIMVTDFKTLLAYDTKTGDSLDIVFEDLSKHYAFFLPLAGMEKAQYQDENIADVKASRKLANLFDEIVKHNPPHNKEDTHALNIFLTRLLFCYFAEDTLIFEDNQFTNAIKSHTNTDGSDLDAYLLRLFEVFNTQNREERLPAYLKAFPYVNGGLFQTTYPIPKFTTKSRAILIEIGSLGWAEINPDIFGSMIQAVVSSEYRGGMGMHYTSVPNIMKVIQPLFLDELYEEFENAKENKRKLQSLTVRIANLKIFDPACGSGNFLIIAYKELRILEMKILKQLDILAKQKSFVFSEMHLSQFYGIELDDFAHEVAKLSLWLAEHQMNLLFYKEFGRTAPSLPLKNGGNISHGNATRLNWEEVCPKEEEDEIYILGNPPYLGSSMQNREQKEDLALVFKGFKNYKNLDYIACWFYLGAKYIQNINAKYAFVTTNSISQGEQVAMLWSHIFDKNLEIFFAHQSFKWSNNAKSNAGVTVAIIGLRHLSKSSKYIYRNNIKQNVNNINAYLVDSKDIVINRRSNPISNIPKMLRGNSPFDGGNLILNDKEKDELINEYPFFQNYVKKLIGSAEFMKNTFRWVLWIDDNQVSEVEKSILIKARIDKVYKMRLESTDKGTRKLSERPHQFRDRREAKKHSILIPRVGSSRRDYIPCGVQDKNIIIADSAQVIYDSDIYIFSILSSKIHLIWVKAVSGYLKTDFRYSSILSYNTFPFPTITKKQKEALTEHTFAVLDERERHSEKTLAQLYDPDKMPEGLKEAHHQLDLAVERCYRAKPFSSDEERLAYLFGLYEEMVEKEVRK